MMDHHSGVENLCDSDCDDVDDADLGSLSLPDAGSYSLIVSIGALHCQCRLMY